MNKKIFFILWLLFGVAFSVYPQTIPPQPTLIAGAESRVYKTIGDVNLSLHIFKPHVDKDKPHAAIIFFFGGGWNTGDIHQFVPQSSYLAKRGMVAIVADYRVKGRQGTTPFEAVEDAKSAVRWVRAHAEELGIDPNRIAAAGGSAGGHLAACTATIDSLDNKTENLEISSKPNALVLFNPVLDMVETGKKLVRFENFNERSEQISPYHHIKKDLPPTIIFHGTGDTVVPFRQAQLFTEKMQANGNRCELVSYNGRRHGFFNHIAGKNPDYFATLRKADEFLISLGYLKGKPAIK